MFRSSTIIRELALNLAKVIFSLKYSVKLRAVQNASRILHSIQHTRHSMTCCHTTA